MTNWSCTLSLVDSESCNDIPLGEIDHLEHEYLTTRLGGDKACRWRVVDDGTKKVKVVDHLFAHQLLASF